MALSVKNRAPVLGITGAPAISNSRLGDTPRLPYLLMQGSGQAGRCSAQAEIWKSASEPHRTNAVIEHALIKLQATPDAYFVLFAACRILPLKAATPTPGAKTSSPLATPTTLANSQRDFEGMITPTDDVCFTPESGHQEALLGCPLCANKRRTALQQNSSPSGQRIVVLLLQFDIQLPLNDHWERERKC